MAQVISCEWCDNAHYWDQCPIQVESINQIGIFNMSQNNPYSNTYNLGWRNHSDIWWGGN